MQSRPLESFPVNTRFKLSALWTGVMFCYIYGDYFELYVPGKVEGLISGQNLLDSPARLFMVSFILVIPALLIFLSLLVKHSLCRWLNIGAGIFFTLFTLLVGMASFRPWYSFYVFLAFLEAIITATIVWQAIKWPREQQ